MSEHVKRMLNQKCGDSAIPDDHRCRLGAGRETGEPKWMTGPELRETLMKMDDGKLLKLSKGKITAKEAGLNISDARAKQLAKAVVGHRAMKSVLSENKPKSVANSGNQTVDRMLNGKPCGSGHIADQYECHLEASGENPAGPMKFHTEDGEPVLAYGETVLRGQQIYDELSGDMDTLRSRLWDVRTGKMKDVDAKWLVGRVEEIAKELPPALKDGSIILGTEAIGEMEKAVQEFRSGKMAEADAVSAIRRQVDSWLEGEEVSKDEKSPGYVLTRKIKNMEENHAERLLNKKCGDSGIPDDHECRKDGGGEGRSGTDTYKPKSIATAKQGESFGYEDGGVHVVGKRDISKTWTYMPIGEFHSPAMARKVIDFTNTKGYKGEEFYKADKTKLPFELKGFKDAKPGEIFAYGDDTNIVIGRRVGYEYEPIGSVRDVKVAAAIISGKLKM